MSYSSFPVLRTVAELRRQVAEWRAEGLTVGLVPTMGALHAGHLALVTQILEHADRAVATLFVNPKQFGPTEDFKAYPRNEDEDCRKLGSVGAHALFAPSTDEMYPEAFSTKVSVPGIGDVLEGSFRPGFFDGVATVVTKLLLQSLPDAAIFGEKDFQQLQVIRRFVSDLDIPVRVIGAPTVREDDGLAMSSRNAYLTADERGVAPALFQTITDVARRVAEGAAIAECEASAARKLLDAGFRSVDYVTVRDVRTLAEVSVIDRPCRVLAAARLGRARLIDNVPV